MSGCSHEVAESAENRPPSASSAASCDGPAIGSFLLLRGSTGDGVGSDLQRGYRELTGIDANAGRHRHCWWRKADPAGVRCQRLGFVDSVNTGAWCSRQDSAAICDGGRSLFMAGLHAPLIHERPEQERAQRSTNTRSNKVSSSGAAAWAARALTPPVSKSHTSMTGSNVCWNWTLC